MKSDVSRCEISGFVARHRRDLLGRCLRMTNGHREAAEDLLGQLELKLVVKVQCTSDEIRDWKAWSITVLKNLRRDQRRATRTTIAWDEEAADDFHPIHLGYTQTEIESRELLTLLGTGWSRLPARQAQALRLRVVEELGYDEIAERLQISVVNARKLVQLARRSLALFISRP